MTYGFSDLFVNMFTRDRDSFLLGMKTLFGEFLFFVPLPLIIKEAFSLMTDHLPDLTRPNPSDKYITDLSDYLPFKHLFDLAKGSMYSEIAARRVVKLKK
jgi:hypothetical protein